MWQPRQSWLPAFVMRRKNELPVPCGSWQEAHSMPAAPATGAPPPPAPKTYTPVGVPTHWARRTSGPVVMPL